MTKVDYSDRRLLFVSPFKKALLREVKGECSESIVFSVGHSVIMRAGLNNDEPFQR